MKTTRTTHGFTLIELLVVISILGLLAALLFPAFAQVRERGRQTACLSNQRQLGMAVLQYLQDHDDNYPVRYEKVVPHENSGGAPWVFQVQPYVKDAQVFQCPDDPTLLANPVLSQIRYTVDSYGINSNLTGMLPTSPDLKSLSQAQLTAPAKTALLFEVSGDTAALTPAPTQVLACSATGNGGTDIDAPTEYAAGVALGCRRTEHLVIFGTLYATGNLGGRRLTPWGGGTTAPRHNGEANYVACDGHTVRLRPAQVSGGYSQPATGTHCDQDDMTGGCGGPNTAAGTDHALQSLTFSIH